MVSKKIKGSALLKKKGAALVTVLIVFAVIAIISATTLMISVSQAKQTQVSVNYNQAYYLARSSVEIVATDLTERIKSLKNIKTSIDNFNKTGTSDDLTHFNSLINQYNTERKFIEDNIIGQTISLSNANGYAAPNVKVYSKLISGNNYIYIEASMTVGNATATAKANLSSFVNNSTRINFTTITTTNTNTNVIYGWGNVNIGNNAKLSNGGTIGYSGNYSGGNKAIANQKITPSLSVAVMVPPSSIWIQGKTAITIPPDGKFTTSGYYGNVSDSSKNLNWSIDTSDHDVTLVFDSILVNSDFTITVNGSHNLYIYLVQYNTDTRLIDLQKDFNIIDNNGNIPLTHIISYDKKMQDSTYSGSNTTIDVKNNASLKAFFYALYTDFTVKNGADIIGSVFANSIDIKNNLNLNYQVSPNNDFPTNIVTTTTTTNPPNSISLIYDTFSGNKMWVK